MERIDQCRLLIPWDRFHEVGDLRAPPLGHRVHQLAALLCQGEPNEASIAPLMSAHDQALLDQAIAHARSGGRRDVHCFGKFGEALWATGCKDNERAVLGEGHLFGYVPKRASCHGNEDPTGAQYGVDDCLTVDSSGESLLHILMIVVANDFRCAEMFPMLVISTASPRPPRGHRGNRHGLKAEFEDARGHHRHGECHLIPQVLAKQARNTSVGKIIDDAIGGYKMLEKN